MAQRHGRTGVWRHPIATVVLYLSKSGVGGPLVVANATRTAPQVPPTTTRSLYSAACRGILVAPMSYYLVLLVLTHAGPS